MVSVFYGWLIDISDELNVWDLGNITTIYFFELNPQKITQVKTSQNIVRLFCEGVWCLSDCIFFVLPPHFFLLHF